MNSTNMKKKRGETCPARHRGTSYGNRNHLLLAQEQTKGINEAERSTQRQTLENVIHFRKAVTNQWEKGRLTHQGHEENKTERYLIL